MTPKCCPHCDDKEHSHLVCPKIIRHGSYYRTSDSKVISRFLCFNCKRSFSHATFSECYRQKKRQKNEPLRRLLASGVSLRRASRLLRLHRKTVVRKFLFLGIQCDFHLFENNFDQPRSKKIEFDDLETFEHSKCKPLSITLAVESGSRRVLGFSVSKMRAKGLLIHKAKKYEPRWDTRTSGRRQLFQKIQGLVEEDVFIKSDQNPHYERDVKEFFPKSKYVQFPGQRGAKTGQGELKKIGFDPLFSLNHTCAKMRADINRLIRKTWCTTKKAENLYYHLAIFADYHNQNLV